MSCKPILKCKIIDIINIDLKSSINLKKYSDEEIKLYIKKNKKIINHCIIEYIEEFGDEILDGGPGSYPEWLNEKN